MFPVIAQRATCWDLSRSYATSDYAGCAKDSVKNAQICIVHFMVLFVSIILRHESLPSLHLVLFQTPTTVAHRFQGACLSCRANTDTSNVRTTILHDLMHMRTCHMVASACGQWCVLCSQPQVRLFFPHLSLCQTHQSPSGWCGHDIARAAGSGRERPVVHMSIHVAPLSVVWCAQRTRNLSTLGQLECFCSLGDSSIYTLLFRHPERQILCLT